MSDFGQICGPILDLAEELFTRLRPYPSLLAPRLGRTKFCRFDRFVLVGEVLCERDADEMVFIDPS